MATVIAVICPSGKAKYFLFWGLTLFPQIRSDLPVGQPIAKIERKRLQTDAVRPRGLCGVSHARKPVVTMPPAGR
jgi:hypothetical protein